MFKLVPVTFFFIIMIYWQVKDLVNNRAWKDLVVYSLLMLVGMVYSYGILLELSLPNPTLFLKGLFKPLYDYIFNQLLV